MGRKNLLTDLLDTKSNAPKGDSPARARPTKGAIGAVSKSIADLKSRALIELDPDQIEAGGLMDRLESDAAAHDALMVSIRDYGQQVPVLVRPHAENPDRYQIVYGRRRLAALRELGQPVKALVRELDDKALILAQGQENSARRDLSFIERANFARQMVDAGYDRKTIGAALHVDKTVISRMLMVADCVPYPLIEAIGPAAGVGRDRWLALSQALETDEDAIEVACGVAEIAGTKGSDAAFEAVLAHVLAEGGAPVAGASGAGGPKSAGKTSAGAALTPLMGAGGKRLGDYQKNADGLSLRLSAGMADGFEEWLVENLSALHEDWLKDQS